MVRSTWIVSLFGVAALCCARAGVVHGQEPTYTGLFADGTYVAAGKISDWHDTGAQPKLNGQPLLDPNRPIRWLRNESPEPQASPRAFVEMIGGDRLPGRVVEYHDGDEASGEHQPDHLTVKVDVSVDVPDQPPRTHLRVTLPSLRRIVWQRRSSDHYAPGTLFYRDGRQIQFRSVRWESTSVVLLLAEGTRRASFSDIAELHLPARDTWDAYYETLAVLTADCTARLLRIETFAGLVATTSLSRFQARAISGNPQDWFHLLAPAWSLDPFWVRHTHIQWRRFFLPLEVPLAQIEPTKIVERSSIGGGWQCQTDRNVQGNPLRNGGKTFGWGFGVQAFAELQFDLPATVKQFQARVGLDEAAGRGGCAKGLVYINKREGEPVARTDHMIGSSESVAIGPIALGGPAAGQKSLVLVADPAHADRPPGSDPLDIRDLVDWLEPVLFLDAEKLLAEVTLRASHAVPAWEGWKAAIVPPVKLQLFNHWDTSNPRDARHRIESLSVGGPLTLGRRVKLTGREAYLLLSVSRFSGTTTPSHIEVRIDGNPITDFDVPERQPNATVEPRLLSLAPYRGREVLIEVVQIPSSDKSWVDWRALGFAEYSTPTPWIPLDIKQARSTGETIFNLQADDSVLAAGKPGEADTFTVAAETDLLGVSAFRLEALADGRLPNSGPGRAPDGSFLLTDFRVSAAPRGKPELAVPVILSGAAADFSNADTPVSAAIDTNPQTGWRVIGEPSRTHYAVFTTEQDIGFPEGTVFTFTLEHKVPQQSLGRFRLLVTNVARPVPAERPGQLLPINWVGKALAIFEDHVEFPTEIGAGGGQATLDSDDKFSGSAAFKIVGYRENVRLPRLDAKIRENPLPGEYRFIQFAWKKVEGESVCLQVGHDGAFGPVGNHSFRYHAGPGPECWGASVQIDAKLPTGWTLVTRDLFQDFGEFNFTGLTLAMVDGQYVLFDRILLGRAPADFEPVP